VQDEIADSSRGAIEFESGCSSELSGLPVLASQGCGGIPHGSLRPPSRFSKK
jgi:hypothetical protein